MWLRELKRIYGRLGISKHLPIASALIWSIAVPDGGSQVGFWAGRQGRAINQKWKDTWGWVVFLFEENMGSELQYTGQLIL